VLATGGEKNTDVSIRPRPCSRRALVAGYRELDDARALSVPRFYHSTALLLPDARVLVAEAAAGVAGAVDDQ